MTLAIKDVEAPLGAEVAGIDVSQPLTASDVKAIVSAWSDRLVLIFHDQNSMGLGFDGQDFSPLRFYFPGN